MGGVSLEAKRTEEASGFP